MTIPAATDTSYTNGNKEDDKEFGFGTDPDFGTDLTEDENPNTINDEGVKTVKKENELGRESTDLSFGENKLVLKTDGIFDLVKGIVGTVLGEPRLTYRKINDEYFKDKYFSAIKRDVKNNNTTQEAFILDVSGLKYINPDDANYAEQISLGNESLTSLSELSRYFYKYGEYSLKMIIGCLVGNKELNPLGNGTKVTFTKLGKYIETNQSDIETTLGIRSNDEKNEFIDKENAHIDFANNFRNIVEIVESNNEIEGSRVSFEDVLISTYISLYEVLIGATIKIAGDLGLEVSTLFNPETAETVVEKITSAFGSTIPSGDDKLFSLYYVFALMTNYYTCYSGINLKDSVLNTIYLIGKSMLEFTEDQMTELLDTTILTQSDLPEYKITLEAYLDTPIFLEHPEIFMTEILEYDTPDKNKVSIEMYKYIDNDYNLTHDPCPFCSTLTSYVSNSVYSEQNVTNLYQMFVNNFVNNIPVTCSPRTIYILALICAQFRIIKDKVKSGKINEIASLGLYQADGYMILLLKEWFFSNKVYKVGDEVVTNDQRTIVRNLKAKLCIAATCIMYNECTQGIADKSYKCRSLELVTNVDRKIHYIDEYNLHGFESDLESLDKGALEILHEYDVYAMSPDSGIEGKHFEIVKMINKNTIPPVSLFIANPNEYGIQYINSIIERDYNQKSMDKLSDYAKNAGDESNMIVKNKLSRCVEHNIADIIKNESSEERFEAYFNLMVKVVLSVAFAKDSYYHLGGDAKDAYIHLEDKDNSQLEENDLYLSLIPRISSQRIFNFLDR